MDGHISLGTVTEATRSLNIDLAEMWEMVCAGRLVATRADDDERWTIWQPDPGAERDER